jgi:hypothetical protein
VFRVGSPFLPFEYFRVPYEQAESDGKTPACSYEGGGCGWLGSAESDSRRLYWVPGHALWRGRVAGWFRLGSIPIFGSLLTDDFAQQALDSFGGSWQRSASICDSAGTPVSSIWTDRGGSVFFPFDPNELIRCYWSEGYSDFLSSPHRRWLRSAARRSYYRVRRVGPRRGQLLARRCFSRIQSRAPFPNWPVETALHDFYAFVFDTVGSLVDEPVPLIAPWPLGFDWALVLTHDVETIAGYENIGLLRDIEISSAYRSSWNFVPSNHHALQDSMLNELRQSGFEVGVHGLRHDGRDISDLEHRLPLIRRYARDWGAVGFRSPATLRDWKAMPRLQFDYDSTYSDTAPYEPQPGGCCSWLPYMIEDLVELPITLPQDHTLFEILAGFDERLWLDKASFLRERGGMALVLTHPDYARNDELISAYKHLLAEFADDATAWKALPREVSGWWRARAASTLTRANGVWSVSGPAAELGRVTFIGDRR